MARDPDQLRPIDGDWLVVGRQLEGNVLDAGGRILIPAGAKLTSAHLQQLGSKLVTGLYGGSDWGDTIGPPLVSPDEPVGELIRPQEPGQPTKRQRTHQRHKWDVPLTLFVHEGTGKRVICRKIRVIAVDLSRSGFAFIYGQYIAVNTHVQARFDRLPNKPRIEGVVRNCRLISGLGHRIGVQFVQTSELPEAKL
jgi:hypothetical protein